MKRRSIYIEVCIFAFVAIWITLWYVGTYSSHNDGAMPLPTVLNTLFHFVNMPFGYLFHGVFPLFSVILNGILWGAAISYFVEHAHIPKKR